MESKLSVVVPQAIGIYLRNRIGNSTGEFLVVVLWGFLIGTMGLIFLTCSLFLHVSLLHVIVCSSIDTPLYWFGLGLLFTTAFSVYAGFQPKFTYTRRFLAKSHVYMQVFGQNPRIHSGFWKKVAYIHSCSLYSHVNHPFW